MKVLKRLSFIMLACMCLYFPHIKGECKNYVVVLDPGHGGDSLGGNMDDRAEREINLITAMACRERLEQYEGIEVYLTRENNTDKELDRKDRLKIAQKYNADLFVSIHYNMSEYHTLYGTEVWTPMSGLMYSKTMEFATIVNEDLADLGLFNRGIKHRMSEDGGEYYGILKYGVEYSIPSVIVEHCHFDNFNDSAFWNEEAYENFGRVDADAIAKYFRLSSESLGLDYSDYERETFDIPEGKVGPDTTAPEYCNVEIISNNEANAYCEIRISAGEPDGLLEYYSISEDGGETFGALLPWKDKESGVCETAVDLYTDRQVNLVVRVYNQYDLTCDSEALLLPLAEAMESFEEEPEDISYIQSEEDELLTESETDKTDDEAGISILKICGFILISFVLLFVIILLVYYIKQRSRRKRRKKRKRNATR